MFSDFELLYKPIIGAGDDHQGHVAVETPEHLASRATRLSTEYEELKTDLREILDQVEYMMIKPAQDTKDNLHLMKKPIKKREDKKLDFERYQNRVDTSLKKKVRSDRDNVALAKAEKELAVAKEQYRAADDHLTNTLPHVLQAVYSLQPYLLAAQVQIQNTLLGHYYTSLHNYCTQEGFPSPAPPMDEVVRLWEEAFKPVQREAEATTIIANGKLVRGGQANGYRRPSQTSTGRAHSVSPARPIHAPLPDNTRPKMVSSASSASLLSVHTPSQPEPLPSPSPAQSAYTTPASSYAPAGPNADYFSRDRSAPNSYNNSTNSSTTALASTIAGKKKPPPPPPRLNSHQFQFVTALYDFAGQGEGDLVFKEGDKIRIIKKTDSTDEWWQGELRGIRGMFPANYCS